MLYLQPAYGSLNFDSANFITFAKSNVKFPDIGKALLVISPIIFLLGLFYTVLGNGSFETTNKHRIQLDIAIHKQLQRKKYIYLAI